MRWLRNAKSTFLKVALSACVAVATQCAAPKPAHACVDSVGFIIFDAMTDMYYLVFVPEAEVAAGGGASQVQQLLRIFGAAHRPDAICLGPKGPPPPPPAGYAWAWTAAGWTIVLAESAYAIYLAYDYATTVDQLVNDPNLGNLGLTQDDFDCMSINVFSSGYWNCFSDYWFSGWGGGGGRGGRGGANGDPHLVTLDGLYYDFQAAGEYVLAQDGAGFRVQARYTPISGDISVTSAVAAKVDDHRISVYANGGYPELYIDGQLTTVSEPVAFSDGSYVMPNTWGGGYQIVWRDGDRMEIAGWGNMLNVDLRVNAKRSGRVRGLLGDMDGDPTNDIRDRSGQVLSQPVDLSVLYGQYGESWRISDEESLFDYAEGESTATFTNTQFPSSVYPTDIESALDPADPAAMQAAAACDDAGITDDLLRQACIHDVFLMDDPSLAMAMAMTPPPPPAAAIIVEATGDTTLIGDPANMPPPPNMDPPPPPPNMDPPPPPPNMDPPPPPPTMEPPPPPPPNMDPPPPPNMDPPPPPNMDPPPPPPPMDPPPPPPNMDPPPPPPMDPPPPMP